MNDFEYDILKMLQHVSKKEPFSNEFMDAVLLLAKQVDKNYELKEQYRRDIETCKSIDDIEVWRLWQVRNFNGNKTWSTVHKIFEWTADEYRRHPHADLMIEYHKGNDADKAQWQFKYNGHDEWTFFTSIRADNKWFEWDELTEYRLKPDPHAELKAQYARDVETCKDIDGLEAWNLWQCITLKGVFTKCDIPPKWLDQSEYRRHPHADSIIKYHQCSERDKQRWQYAYRDTWLDCNGEPDWYEHTPAFRLKPETITINKEYNAPLRDSKGIAGEYVYLDFNGYDFFASVSKWDNDFCDNKRLESGLIFASKEDCQAVADAFNAILRGGYE
jgi:hypothetical protein